uniref:Ubiquitin specific peptidase 40 n=1 Tax=Salmo trutta TaxID=8032 RepID=A0A674DRG0_SALTR
MFGSLFEEQGEGYSLAPSGGRVVKGEGEPPPPRGRVNLSGIKNQGGTCYLNSLLQTLLFTPEFREELFSLGPKELGCLEDKDKPEAKVRVIPLELQRLFARLLLVDQQSASTADLTDSFGWNNSEESRQHDVQELNRILFSALEHSLVDTSGSAFIQRLYHGTTVNSIHCKECGNISQRQEDYLDLTVCVRGVCGLERALWDMFVEEEMFEGSNLYLCGQCDQLVTAAKSAKLRKLPPFLTVSLLRFNFDFARCERYKETGRYTFPLTINLRPFCEQTEDEDSEYSYELFSVIIHKGGCYGGHYHVYIKDMDHLGLWEPPVRESGREEERTIIAYQTIEESRSVLLDQLGQRLMDKIGSSWSKKYRKLHGPIGKGSHWFDLNDSTVTSIHERDVEKMYQGKESAYMLFYRKTLLRRPSGGGWVSGGVWVEENRRLQQRREEFEASNNSVELRLHLAPHYRLENGALKSISIEQKEATNLTLDRRRTVGDLRMIIYQKQDLWEGDMALTVARSLPAGLHLYNTLTDDEVSLYSAGILTGTDLFVWNGREVCGATVQTGGEWEPVLLTVVQEGGSGLTKESRGFAGRVTLGEVREALGETQESLLCQEKRGGEGEGGGASGWRVFPPGDMQRTLKELALKDGDALLVLEPQTQDSRWAAWCVCARQCVSLRNPVCVCVLPPLVCEELSVRDAGVRLMTSLSLCPGTAPKDTQLFLYFSVGTAPSSDLEGEIIVERFSTVKQVGNDCVSFGLLVGDGWHLRRLDWCEEVGEALMDEVDTHTHTHTHTHSMKPSSLVKMCVCLVGGAMVELRTVGQVEISEEATLEELKTQVLTLPALQYVCVPSPAFLRVWQLEGQRLTRILRGQQHTLRKLKLSSGVEFCVQQLLREEDLGPKEVLLRVQMGVPGERGYYPPEELVWDASRDPSPRSLRSALASTYGLSPDSLLLAKHQPHTHTWETFSNWSQQVSKRKKKKKAESLLGAPFHLKDGDIIGVKVTNAPLWLIVLVAFQPALGQCAGAEVETNRGVGPAKKMGPIKARKPEVALSINVGVFR